MDSLRQLPASADLFVPDDLEPAAALARTTHLCVAAHQDDQEFMALSGIAECFGRPDSWFSGVVVTDGGGSARSGRYADFSDEQMKEIRRREQRKAAVVGEYACQLQLGHPSDEVKDPTRAAELSAELRNILLIAQPEVVYLHNPADKHDTHVACCLRALEALRALPPEARPERVFGCEVWRDLDWLLDADKAVLPTDPNHPLAAALAGVFDSQLAGGKRYDLALQGRWRANATMFESHAVDRHDGLSWAIDLSPLVQDPELSVIDFTLSLIDRLRADVQQRAKTLGGR